MNRTGQSDPARRPSASEPNCSQINRYRGRGRGQKLQPKVEGVKGSLQFVDQRLRRHLLLNLSLRGWLGRWRE